MRLVRIASVLLLLAGTAQAQGRRSADAWADFDAYVAAAAKAWRIPGMAIAVVQGDSVVFARGYGVRTAGGSDAVSAHTLFANASTTKAFTALAAAMLVDEGKLRWSERISDLLPSFRLADLEITRELTLRDILSHHTGFPDPDYLWYGRPDSVEEIIRRMRFIRPGTGLRTGYAYNNGTYALAGYVTGRAAGVSWEELIRRRILDPLGMTAETVANTAGLAGRTDVATPHEILDDTVQAIDRYDLDNIAPAGSMYSSVLDMTRWIRFLLAGGRAPDGTRLVSAASFAEVFKPQVLIPITTFYPTSRITKPHFTAYGLGWFLHDYRGEFAAFHTGSIDGMTALVGLLPERKAGMVIFANLDHAELRHALMYRVFDRVLGVPARDWSGEVLTLYGGIRADDRKAQAKRDSARVMGTRPSLPLESYAGVYRDSLYGKATVTVEDGRLVLSASELLTADLMHWHYDTFSAVYRKRWVERGLVSFRLDAEGRVAGLELGPGRVLGRVPQGD